MRYKQRKIIYERRNEILDTEDIHGIILDMFKDNLDVLLESHIEPEGYLTDYDLEHIVETVNHLLLKNRKIKVSDLQGLKEDEVYNVLCDEVIADYEDKIALVPEEIARDFEKHISLRVIDEAWVKHIADMDHLREGIGLRGYGQSDPLQAYALEGYEMFEKMQDNIDASVCNFLAKMEIKQNLAPKQMQGNANDGKDKVRVTVKNDKKIGRNDTCPCGSGKKYKQCCGK